jgi:hypothetical protein
VLDGRGKTVLEPQGTWTVPVLKIAAIDDWASWPFWVFVLLCSLLLALAGRQMLLWEVPPAAVVVAVTGLALLARREHLGLAVVLFITSGVLHAKLSAISKSIALMGCLGLSVLITIEFGFVWFLALALFLPDYWQSSSKWGRGFAVLALALLAMTLWRWPGFAEAFWRPVSWIGLAPPDSIFSRDQSVFATGQDWQAGLLLLLIFALCWMTLWWKADQGVKFLLPLGFLTLLGFGHPGYLWISGLALALVFRVPVRSEISPKIGHAVLAVALVFGLIRFLPKSGSYLDLALGEATPPLVEPARWFDKPTRREAKGRVMLLDLSQSVDWQHAETRARFELLMDDRWEVFREDYPHYAMVCRDMREVLADSYLREDQKWGGYIRWLYEWKPTLLVANSSNVWDIRRLSLSPHWRIMGIDAQRTIFGLAEDPQTYKQAAKTLGMLNQLEWPPLSGSAWPENVIAASTPSELLKVSKVLNALRFPYAALRLLPELDTAEIQTHRTYCHLEIAHRVYRHSGEGSLLDQFRAVHGVRLLLASPNHDPQEVLQALSSLEGLGLNHLAHELAESWLSSGVEDLLSSQQREELESLRTRTNADSPGTTKPNPSDAETQIRTALLEGDQKALREGLEHIEQPLRDYYALLGSAWDVPLAGLLTEMTALLERPDFPEQRRGEALFYQGCLALEAGDSQAAVSAFRNSAQVDLNSPFRALRQLYRLQLGDQSASGD